ncbi:MAG: twin transmembrane helix small protein [Hyphomicrobiaceae bacterium]|nr:twin transmembrane helix small protein [Hyphomicrobiaceae bacterium]
MQTALYYLTTVAVFAVAVVLVLGLWSLFSQKSSSRSQMLMRWRVGLQFLAILIIMAFLLVKGW